MRTTWRIFTIFLVLLISSVLVNTQAARAQSSTVREPARRPPEAPGTAEPRIIGAPEPGLRFLSAEMSVNGQVVKHAPYSAETLTESTQTLGNGTKLTRRATGMIYRDNEGRMRRELSATTAGPFATLGDTQRMIVISDPANGISKIIIPKGSDPARSKIRVPTNNDAPPDTETSSENSRTESLGKQMIEGIEAEGTRTTILIPEGRIGNDKPIEIVHERWYSPELQTILLSKHSDPRWGETVYKLLNINRNEPDSSLFRLPKPPTSEGNKTRPRR